LERVSSKVMDDVYPSKRDREDDIVTHLRNIKLEQNLDFNAAAVSLPVNSAIVQVIQVPYLDDDELKVSADNGSLWESTISIPGELSEYSIFWQVIKKDLTKNTLSLLFVASRVDEIESHCELVRRAGFDPVVVDVRCFALRNILKTYEDSKSNETQVFIEISGQENYAVCMHEGLPFIYDIYMSDKDMDSLIKGGEALTDELFSRMAAQIRTAIVSFIKQSGVPGIETIQMASSLPFVDTIYESVKKEVMEYKIELLNPIGQLRVPAKLRTRIDSEKNISSWAIAAGLATRQLDVFGYYKFVTAVSNINLLPDRKSRIEKEKKKSNVSSLMKNFAIIGTIFFVGTATLYGHMMINLPSHEQIESITGEANSLEQSIQSQTETLDALKLWTYESGEINRKILDFTYASSFPLGSYVTEIKQFRGKDSLLTVKVNSPSLSSGIKNTISKVHDDVRVLNMAIAESGSKNKLTTLKIAYEIK
jgi:type IV pilus assembly protein PilN